MDLHRQRLALENLDGAGLQRVFRYSGMNADDGVWFFGLAGLASPAKKCNERKRQIEIESASQAIHSGITQTEQPPDVKIDMGRQTNKIQKRRRRDAYLKRKKTALKAKAKKG